MVVLASCLPDGPPCKRARCDADALCWFVTRCHVAHADALFTALHASVDDCGRFAAACEQVLQLDPQARADCGHRAVQPCLAAVHRRPANIHTLSLALRVLTACKPSALAITHEGLALLSSACRRHMAAVPLLLDALAFARRLATPLEFRPTVASTLGAYVLDAMKRHPCSAPVQRPGLIFLATLMRHCPEALASLGGTAKLLSRIHCIFHSRFLDKSVQALAMGVLIQLAVLPEACQHLAKHAVIATVLQAAVLCPERSFLAQLEALVTVMGRGRLDRYWLLQASERLAHHADPVVRGFATKGLAMFK